MAPTLLKTRRLSLNFVLVTIFLFLAISAKTLAADALSDKIDHDLFLDDEGSSGDCGSGDLSDDDEDTRCRDPPIVTSKPGLGRSGDTSTKPTVSESPKVHNAAFPEDIFNRTTTGGSFFSQPGILAAIICGAIVGLLCAILLVMFIVYRMRKKDEGSYVLDDSKRATPAYGKSKEFYA